MTAPPKPTRRELMRQFLFLAGAGALPHAASWAQKGTLNFDIVIYGGTSAAVSAAVYAARKGKSVVIVCPETHLGGLTTSGLGWTDSKNGNAIGGLAREFYHRIWLAYQKPEAWVWETRQTYLDRKIGAQPGQAIDEIKQVMWTFEPHVAEAVIEAWVAEEKITVLKNEWLLRTAKGVEKKSGQIIALHTLSGKRIAGKMFIDAGYEGDLMAAAGVTYRVGRDNARGWDEPLNGVRFSIKGVDRYFSSPYPVDPYLVPGKPESGFIAGIEGAWDESHDKLGESDTKRFQSFNFRLCLTQNDANRVPIARPKNYDEAQYELLFRLLSAGETSGFTTQAMPNLKIDANSHGRMSGDFIGGNFSIKEKWNYSDADYKKRKQIVQAHRDYQQGLLWTLQNHERVPAKTRQALAPWGLSKNEFADNDHWPYQLYVREARRMVGMATVTQHHVQQKAGYPPVRDSIGMGSYSLDSHTTRRVVIDGKIRDEGGFYVWEDRPYPLPLGCIVPQKSEVENLLVPVTVSATHAAFGSIRMEPTYLILGQSVATIACLALDSGLSVQDVPYDTLAKQLTKDKQVLFFQKNASVT